MPNLVSLTTEQSVIDSIALGHMTDIIVNWFVKVHEGDLVCFESSCELHEEEESDYVYVQINRVSSPCGSLNASASSTYSRLAFTLIHCLDDVKIV